MLFEVFTLFPELFPPYLQTSILNKAVERGLVSVRLHNIREFAVDRHRITDDEPYGGGGGMVMKPEPIFRAVESVLGAEPDAPVILLSPQGEAFTHSLAAELAQLDRLALVCGRYEGVDERVRDNLVTREVSIGDYVLTGGELPALVLIDAVSRMRAGVLGDPQAAENDSFSEGLLEHPHYTRPPVFRAWEVPEVLRSGDHARIARWRREESLRRTFLRRPELLERADLSDADRRFLRDLQERGHE